jgi:hypothetical protein
MITEHPSVIKRGRARLRKSLRRAQIKSALSGNSTMLVWLGKQYLGQSDRLDHSVSAEHKVRRITPNVLERLHTSYRRTMEQLRTRVALPAATEEAGGLLGNPPVKNGPLSKQGSEKVHSVSFEAKMASDSPLRTKGRLQLRALRAMPSLPGKPGRRKAVANNSVRDQPNLVDPGRKVSAEAAA